MIALGRPLQHLVRVHRAGIRILSCEFFQGNGLWGVPGFPVLIFIEIKVILRFVLFRLLLRFERVLCVLKFLLLGFVTNVPCQIHKPLWQ